MVTHIGFSIFSGLMLGGVIGGFGFNSPAAGALIGGGAGLVLGLVADLVRRKRRRSDADETEKTE